MIPHKPGTLEERAPERSCPRCGGAMRRLATLCAGCWLKVAPTGEDGVEPPPSAHPPPLVADLGELDAPRALELTGAAKEQSI
jgi:hypothetical protein